MKKQQITTASSKPSASTKHTIPASNVQAAPSGQRTQRDSRRNIRKGKTGSFRTLLPKKGHQATEESTPKAGQSDTMRQHGGHNCSASSRNRKCFRQQRIYDPLLGSHSIPVVKVPTLLEQIVEDDNFLQALAAVRRDPNKAAGFDHKSIRDVCNSLLTSPEAREKVRQDILHGKYRPEKVRTVQIPKANGKMRTLGIATVMDRVVQTMILQAVMKNLPENPWSSYSYAYQSGRGVADAIREVNRIRREGYQFGIALDLKAFFDNVPHDRLIRKLHAHLTDKRVVKLVTAFLTPLVIGKHGTLTKNRIGTPQGSVLSPWLASELYMDELDKEMTRRKLRFVRYADDVTVFCRSKKAANRVKARLMCFIENTMRCPVNREKTTVTGIEHLSLLGVNLEQDQWHILRKKERTACAGYLDGLNRYAKTKNDFYLLKAAQRMNGFINHYKRIPEMARDEVPALKRWCRNRWKAVAGYKWYHNQGWFLLKK